MKTMKWILLSAAVFAVMYPSLSEKHLADRPNTTYNVINTYSVSGTDGYVYDNCVQTLSSGYTYAGTGACWTVRVNSGYLALRTAKAYDSSNEIGELYTGDTVEVLDASDSGYWYVYSPKLGKYGYVNCSYLC